MKVLGGVGWDKKEFLESNLHMYGGDDAKNYSIWHGNVAQEEKKERNHCNDPFNSCNLDHQLDI